MRVTQVSTWGVQCGIAEYTGLLCEALERHGVTHDVVAIDRDHAAYLSKRELQGYFDELGEQLQDAELVHIQHEFAFFSGSYHFRSSVSNFRRLLKAAQRGGRPVLVTFHTSPFFVDWSKINWTSEDPIKQALLRGAKAWWRAGAVSFINRQPRVFSHAHGRTGRRLLIDSGLRPDRIAVIAHGTPAPRPAPAGPSRAEVRERLGLDPEATVLGIFGFLATSKGQADALAALEHLPEQFQLLLIGGPHPGDHRSVLGDVVEAIRLKPELRARVAITGFVDETEARVCLDAADIMIAPYRDGAQTVSGAFGWALASGKPVVASRIPAFRELVHEARCAELVAVESPGELALAIQRLAADDELRARLVSNALAWCEANSWDAVAGRHAELYHALLAGEPRPAALAGTDPFSARQGSGDRRPLLTAGEETLSPSRQVSEEGPRRGRASAVLRPAALPDGRRLTFAIDPNATEDSMSRVLFERGYPADPAGELVLHLLGTGGTLLDIGAGLGTVTLPAAATGCRVLALEPSAATVRLLRTAVAYNGFDSVRVVHGTPAAGPGTVHADGNGSTASITREVRLNGGGSGHEIRAHRVDDLLRECGIERVDVVRLTVGGYELDALVGLARTLRGEHPPAIVFQSDATALGAHGRTIAELKRTLEEHGYSLFLIDRHHPGRLMPVTAHDLQAEMIAEYLGYKGDPAGVLAPWRIGRAFDERELVERLRVESRAPDSRRRRYAAAVLRIAPGAVARDPQIRAMLAELREVGDPELARLLDGDESIARYGLGHEAGLKGVLG